VPSRPVLPAISNMAPKVGALVEMEGTLVVAAALMVVGSRVAAEGQRRGTAAAAARGRQPTSQKPGTRWRTQPQMPFRASKKRPKKLPMQQKKRWKLLAGRLAGWRGWGAEMRWEAVGGERKARAYKAEKRRRKHLEHEAGEHKDRPVAGCAGCEPWLIPYGVTPDPDPRRAAFRAAWGRPM
jgi:hypothetical protein